MTELSQLILDRYQVRKTRKQKTAFIELIKEHFPQMQLQGGRLPKSRNMIIGDVEKANIIFTAHYDTCAQLPFPNFIAPMRPMLSLLYSLLVLLPIVAVVFALDYFLGYLTADFWAIYAVNLACLGAIMYMMMAGITNKHTANDNTSGVITVLEILQELDPQDTNTAFVLFDNEEVGLMGSALFRRRYKKLIKHKLLINFDCVSDGDHIMLAVSKEAMHYRASLDSAFCSTDKKQVLIVDGEKIYYPSDQIGFAQNIAVAALKKKKWIGYYMDRIHTKRDVIFEEENIDLLKKGAVSLAHMINSSTSE